MIFRSVAVGSAMAFLMACGGKTDAPAAANPAPAPSAEAPAAPPAPAAKPLELTTSLDIGAAVMAKDPDDTGWKGISIQAPAGAKVDASPGGTMIFIDDSMSVGLGGERDLAEKKKQAQEDTLQGFKRFLVDTPDAILWETTGGNFIFIANVKLGEKVKSCETAGYGTFTQKNAETLLEACRGMKLAP